MADTPAHSSHGSATPSDPLPCGATVDALLEQVADHGGSPSTDHQAGCPHCRSALAELENRWRPVARASDVPVEVPPGLTEAIKARIRAAASGRPDRE